MENRRTDMNIFIKHNIPNGCVRSVPCKISILGMDRAEDLFRLHNDVAEGVSRDLFSWAAEDELRRFLSDEGFTVGVTYKDRLICARTIRTSEKWIREYLAETNRTPECYGNPAITGFCVVDKEFRGNDIQFLTQYYAESFLIEDFDCILTSASPNNVHSLQNLLKCGFNIIDIKVNRDNNRRYILKKSLIENGMISIPDRKQISMKHLDSQERFLKKGYIGYKLVKRIHGMDLLFAKLTKNIEK